MLKQGFTLIELMVVIVIIGVLASLAIPRFTEASAKAKMAEAPRVLASYESAYLAAVAEMATVTGGSDALIFEKPNNSKWFTYDVNGRNGTTEKPADDPDVGKATASSQIGSFPSTEYIATYYMTGDFGHTASDKGMTPAKKMIPNFGPLEDEDDVKNKCTDGKKWVPGKAEDKSTTPPTPAVDGECKAES
jgi:prepilin-type N-terminal cleavage/methylation domain-containing protein